MIQSTKLRTLNMLDHSASTARVLNLWRIHKHAGSCFAGGAAPFFQNKILDRSIILKHWLRPDEHEYFDDVRRTATKVLLPIDPTDLRSGAQSFYIGERDCARILQHLFGEDLLDGAHDRKVLDLLDSTPSLDPFILRESLKSEGIVPAEEYFEISHADQRRMHAFVEKEIAPIAALTMAQGDQPQVVHRLAGKLLSTWPELEFADLGEALKLDEKDYVEGMRAWKGLLYYKWVLGEVRPAIGAVLNEISRAYPVGYSGSEADPLFASKRKVRKAAISMLLSAQAALRRYDNAYSCMTEHKSVTPFRTFLLNAPNGFRQISELLCGLQHVVSFWRFRFPDPNALTASSSELVEIIRDFEQVTMASIESDRDEQTA